MVMSNPSTAPPRAARSSSCYCCCCSYYKRKCSSGTRNNDGHLSSSSSQRGSGSGDNVCGLSVTSCLSALLSLLVVTVAISTDEWLLTEEKLLPNARTRAPAAAKSQQQAGNQQQRQQQQQQQQQQSNNNTSSAEPDSKLTRSGLWKVCVATSTRIEFECQSIEYFSNEEYNLDPTDSTMAVPYAVTKSASFFLIATSLLLIAEVCYFAAHVCTSSSNQQKKQPRQLYVFIAGVLFIVSGLLMLVGMIMYISLFKAEVGSKLRLMSSFQEPLFTYRYGFSFLLYVSGFVTTELAGTTAIFLYISWHQRYHMQLARAQQSHSNYSSARKNFACVHHLENHLSHPNYLQQQQQQQRQSSEMLQLATPLPEGAFICERHHQKRYFFSRADNKSCVEEEVPSAQQLVQCDRGYFDAGDDRCRRYQPFYTATPVDAQQQATLPTPLYCHIASDLTAQTISTSADIESAGIFSASATVEQQHGNSAKEFDSSNCNLENTALCRRTTPV